ncbi:MAG: hypothetical protein AAFR23_10945, partial [Pseudomonadota bacterium]
MPLQNRVRPNGEIVSVPERGTLMGNRGGRIHGSDKRLGKRRWASRAWIACVLDFKARHRTVMAPNSYTELFFLDEATALAAGHRPCYECRRRDARLFAAAWSKANGLTTPPRAPDMDRILHADRLDEAGAKRTFRAQVGQLPNGVMVAIEGIPFLLIDQGFCKWTFSGYAPATPLPSHDFEVDTSTS